MSICATDELNIFASDELIDALQELDDKIPVELPKDNIVYLASNTSLKIAAIKNYYNVCELLLNNIEINSLDINSTDPINGMTALILAVINNNNEICKLLLEKGADPKLSDNEYNTALFFAISNNNEEICKLLIRNGALINNTMKDEKTALMIAAEKKLYNICKILIESSAELELQDSHFFTALLYAVKSGCIDTCLTLIDAGANMNYKTPIDICALKIAQENKFYDILQLLVSRGVEVNIRDYICIKTPLISAILSRDMKLIDILLIKCNIDFLGGMGRTPIMYAAKLNDEEICKKLLEHKPNLEITDMFYEETVLIEATENGFHNIVQLLIDAGSNVNHISKKFYTPLYYAIIKGYLSICHILIAAGADPNYINISNGETLLHLACREQQIEIAIFLTEYMFCDKITHLNIARNSALEVWGISEYNNFIVCLENKKRLQEHLEAVLTDLK